MGERVNTTLKENSQNKAAGNGRRGNQNAFRHGSYARVRALKGGKWDRRTREWKAIAAREREICKALGRSMSPQKAALVHEIATLEAVLLPPLDVYLVGAKIVKRGGKVDPAVELRLRLSSRLQELLKEIGLERVRRTPRPAWAR